MSIENLRAARALLTPPGAWNKHDMALDARGRETGWRSPDAVSWCLLGAIYKCDVDCDLEVMRAIYDTIDEIHLVSSQIISFNDYVLTNQDKVLELLDKTIERLSE